MLRNEDVWLCQWQAYHLQIFWFLPCALSFSSHAWPSTTSPHCHSSFVVLQTMKKMNAKSQTSLAPEELRQIAAKPKILSNVKLKTLERKCPSTISLSSVSLPFIVHRVFWISNFIGLLLCTLSLIFHEYRLYLALNHLKTVVTAKSVLFVYSLLDPSESALQMIKQHLVFLLICPRNFYGACCLHVVSLYIALLTLRQRIYLNAICLELFLMQERLMRMFPAWGYCVLGLPCQYPYQFLLHHSHILTAWFELIVFTLSVPMRSFSAFCSSNIFWL